MNNPFDIIKAFHTKDWEKIKDRDKSKNFFMINRLCSISFPLQANSFNHIKIQPEKAVDFWKILISHQNKKTPQWIWTKTVKKGSEESSTNYKEEVLEFIKNKHQVSNREIQEMINFFPSKFKSYYKEIESLLS